MAKSVKRLIETFIPTHYELTLSPDRHELHFSGTVTIHGRKVGRPSQRLTFHQNSLKVTSAVVTRKDKKGVEEIPVNRINHQNTLHEVRLHSDRLLYPGEYTVIMTFEAPITKAMTGLYPCFFKHENQDHILLATQFESHHAREVFPCIDEPAAKATFDLSLIHEAGLTALGNTPITSQEDAKGNKIKTTFERSPKMSSYLLAFVLGDIHNTSGKTKSGVEVNIWGTIAQPKESFEFALDTAIRSIEFFEDYFDTPYPLAKADHIALPDFSSGAMENWGLITYREAVLLLYPDAVSQSTKELIATVVAHETSHQWFGNLVTMKWWDDLWLNESFANMMEYACVDAMFPDWHIWESFVTVEGLSALRRDATPGVQAVKTAVHHPDEISTLFDPSIVYAKGGRLLYMLKNYIGDDAWRAGLTAYFKKHAYGNTTGADLWASLSEASGKDIGAFMNPWLERSGFPVLRVEHTGSALSISQEHFLDDPAKADEARIWPTPIFSDRADIPALLDKKELSTDLVTSETPLIINQDGRGHYIVHYTDSSHQQALKQLIHDDELGIIDRLYLLVSSGMLARAGYASFGETLDLLQAYDREHAEAVWDIMSLVVADTRRFIDHDEKIEAALKTSVRKLIASEYARLGWDESADDSAADQKLRANIIGLGLFSEDKAVANEALQRFRAYQKSSDAVSAELRGLIFAAAVKQAEPGAVDYLLDLHDQTQSSELQRDIMGGLTATKDAAIAERLLGRITNAKLVKPQDADRWLIYLLRNRHTRSLAWQWMEDNWQWIVDTYKQDKSYDNFPRYAAMVCNTRDSLERYKKFFEPKLDETALKRNIMIGIEEINSRVTWLERDLSAVQAHFMAK